MKYTIENDNLWATIDSHGAELVSVIKKETLNEYMWQKKRYWKRSSPVLFPIVGNVAEGRLSIDGVDYPMSQHGFARDMEFELVEQKEDRILFSLKYNEETLQKYPYHFELKIGYQLVDNEVRVSWEVSDAVEDMYFMIGAHPAFNCPPRKVTDPVLNSDVEIENHDRTGCFVDYHTNNAIKYNLIDGKLLGIFDVEMESEDGFMRLDEHTFDRDALVIEGDEIHEVSLCDAQKKPFVTVKFEEPLVGIWSPVGDSVPFVCIEPWFGRTDRLGFIGDISKREYEQRINRDVAFNSTYTIIIE